MKIILPFAFFFLLLTSCNEYYTTEATNAKSSVKLLLRTNVAALPGDSIIIRLSENGVPQITQKFAPSDPHAQAVQLNWGSHISVAVRYFNEQDTSLVVDTSFIMPELSDIGITLFLQPVTSMSSSSLIISSSSSAINPMGNNQNCEYSELNNTLRCVEKTYATITIGSQILFAENLNIGTMISGLTASDDQSNDTLIQKYCYQDSESNCSSDGGLYQWAKAMALPSTCNTTPCDHLVNISHHQGICPIGWHIPKAHEWDLLATTLGDSTVAGRKMKINNTGNSNWDSATNNDGNSSGFSAVPAGLRSYTGGFSDRYLYTYYWVAAENDTSLAHIRFLYHGNSSLSERGNNKSRGFSIRCFKDD